jgi:solute carrier family 8 (sodium/calcium exchanger)
LYLQGKEFPVPSGTLGFSVILYTCCAVIAIGLFIVRRNVSFFGYAELGGPVVGKWICGAIYVSLWVFYVVMSSLQAQGTITVNI